MSLAKVTSPFSLDLKETLLFQHFGAKRVSFLKINEKGDRETDHWPTWFI